MSKSKGWTIQSSLLMLWMEKTQVNNQTKIAGEAKAAMSAWMDLTEICPSRRVGHFKAPC